MILCPLNDMNKYTKKVLILAAKDHFHQKYNYTEMPLAQMKITVLPIGTI